MVVAQLATAATAVLSARVRAAKEVAVAVVGLEEVVALAGHPLEAQEEISEMSLTERQTRGMAGRAGRHSQAAHMARRCCRGRGNCDRPHHCPRRPVSLP